MGKGNCVQSIPLIDVHCHLQDERFAGKETEALKRMLAAGVRYCVVNGTHPDDWERVARLAQDHTSVIPSFGLHPWRVSDAPTDWFDALRGYLAKQPSALGEIGLDRWKTPRDETLQEQCFLAQLQLGADLNLPCTLHCLRAWGWMLDKLRNNKLPPRGFLLHSYNASVAQIAQLVDLGAYFSFSPPLASPHKHRLREALQAIPMDRLLFETDAPDMAPPPELGANVAPFPNEPANLPQLLAFAAHVRGISSPELAEKCWENAIAFFAPLISTS